MTDFPERYAVQISDTYFVVHKAMTTVAYVAAALLTIRFFRGHLDLPFASGCILLSGVWCLLVRVKMSHFLQTYFDVFSRLEMEIPVALGVLLCTAALASHAIPMVHITAGALILCWFAIQAQYRQNRKKYVKQGYGPVPDGTWVSPPVSQISAGDLVLTNGAVARNLHESVGHAASVIERPDGLYAISSHMDRGCTVEPIADVLGEVVGHYLILKLTEPLSAEQSQKMTAIAQQMVDQNQQWAHQRNQWWHDFVQRQPLSDGLKQKLLKLYRCSGYDWLGMFMGRLEPNRWTCIGAALELYRRVGIKTNPYGTGLLGVGTTLFDPIMPVRFLNDSALRLLMTSKQEVPAPLLFD